jgi:RHS repeat-associated protein
MLHTRIASAAPGGEVHARDVRHDYGPRPGDVFPGDPAAVRRLIAPDGGEVARYDHDRSGNLIRKALPGGATWEFAYDGDDKLREAAVSGGAESSREVYFYDHAGRRMLAVAGPTSPGVSRGRLWFGGTQVHYGPSGSPVDSWVDVGMGAHPVARIKGRTADDVELTYHGVLGSLLAVLDRDGAAVARFSYGPYGEVLASDGDETARYRQRFNAKEVDAVTGLSYYGHRYHDRLSLDWTQADPSYRFTPELAFDEPRRVNPYAFALRNPLRMVDPDGRDPNDTSLIHSVSSFMRKAWDVVTVALTIRVGSWKELERAKPVVARFGYMGWTNSSKDMYINHTAIATVALGDPVITKAVKTLVFLHELAHAVDFRGANDVIPTYKEALVNEARIFRWTYEGLLDMREKLLEQGANRKKLDKVIETFRTSAEDIDAASECETEAECKQEAEDYGLFPKNRKPTLDPFYVRPPAPPPAPKKTGKP